jgi:quinol monooxygenase YgiN
MPVAVRISPQHMSKDDYARVVGELEASGLSEPEGRISHAAYGEDEVHMFEVWRSPEDFDAHRDSMFAVMQGAGVDGGSVEMHPLHSELPD